MTSVLQRVVDVKRGEVAAVLLSFTYFFLLLFSYYLIRPVRDAMGAEGGVRQLHWLFTGTFLATLVVVPLFGIAVARLPRRRFVPLIYRFFIVNIAVFWALIHFDVARVTVGRAFFIWASVYNLFVVSVFWSFMADAFRNEQGRRLFGFIAAGGSLGALSGPYLTRELAEPLGIGGLLIISAVGLELAVRAAGALARRSVNTEARDPERIIGGNPFAGITRVLSSPYLFGIGLYILCLTITATMFYFHQIDIARDAFDDRAGRTAFFASIDLFTNLFTIAIQVYLAGRLIKWIGVAAVLAILPIVTAIGLVALAAAPALWVLVAFQTMRRATNYALARPARELLYTVVGREDKYKAKNVTDTVIYRGGDALTSWGFAALASVGLTLGMTTIVVLPFAGVWLVTGILLGKRQERMKAEQHDDQAT
jgi:AAA family ATP:ADP antiporter